MDKADVRIAGMHGSRLVQDYDCVDGSDENRRRGGFGAFVLNTLDDVLELEDSEGNDILAETLNSLNPQVGILITAPSTNPFGRILLDTNGSAVIYFVVPDGVKAQQV